MPLPPTVLLIIILSGICLALGLLLVRELIRRRHVQQRLDDYLMLAEQANAAVFVVHGERFSYLNPYCEKMTGYPLDALYRGTYDQALEANFPFTIREQIGQSPEGTVFAREGEARAVRADGSEFWLDYVVTAQKRRGQQVILGIGYEITERKRTELALQQLNTELEERVEERTAALREANAQLETLLAEYEQNQEILEASRKEERRFREELHTLLEVHNTLTTAPSVDALCRSAVELGHSRLGLDRLSFWFTDETPGEVTGSFGIDETGELRDEREQRLSVAPGSLMGRALTETARLTVEDETPLLNDQAEVVGTGIHVIAALRDGEKTIGCLSMDNLLSHRPLLERRRELLGLYAVTLGHLYALKRAGEALREAHRTLEAMIAASPLAIVTLDAQGRIQSWNPAAGRMFNITARESIGQYPPAVKAHQFDKYQAVMARIRNGETVTDYEAIVYLPDGRELPIAFSGAPLRDDAGTVTGIVGMLADISERKRGEEQIRSYQEQLRALTSEALTTEERERRRLAQQVHDSISQTLALAKIRLGSLRAEVGATGCADELAAVTGLLDQLIQSTRSLTFELSPPILYELGLHAAVEWLAEDIQRQYGITTTVEHDKQRWPISDDLRAFLFMATREALINVVKHAGAKQAGITLQRTETQLSITVSDNGAGFDVSQLDHPRGHGGGFGLFSIRERLRYLGGRLDIASAPGEGTTVTIHAPRGDEAKG